MSYLKLAGWSATALLLGTGAGFAQATCAGLAGTTIPAEVIGMKTTGAEVAGVEDVAASDDGPAHCLVFWGAECRNMRLWCRLG